MTSSPRPREVWWVDLEPTVGSEADKARPAAVVGSADFEAIPLRLVVPTTTWQDRFHFHRNKVFVAANSDNGLDFDSAFDAIQIRSASLDRFMHQAGILTDDQYAELMRAVALVASLIYPGDLDPEP